MAVAGECMFAHANTHWLAYLCEAAGPHGAGMQGKADLLEHIRMGGHPAQAHPGGQELAEAVQAHNTAIHIHRQVCGPQSLKALSIPCRGEACRVAAIAVP